VPLALTPVSVSHCGLPRRVHDLLEFAALWHAGNLSISEGVEVAELQVLRRINCLANRLYDSEDLWRELVPKT
jgi:hypothetical protein